MPHFGSIVHLATEREKEVTLLFHDTNQLDEVSSTYMYVKTSKFILTTSTHQKGFKTALQVFLVQRTGS